VVEPVVDIRDLTFTYSENSIPALIDINLKVLPGEFVTITGDSGCGKSTLALCLAGFIPSAFPGKMRGTVRIQGKETGEYLHGGLSGIVGLVQQDPEAQLCTLSVKDEVAFGLENLCFASEKIRENVQFALAAVGAEALLDRKVHTLSGGEKQRVAIASVLAMNPSLLILDEPTANLDPHCTEEVLRVLENLKKKRNTSIIVIEHRLDRLLPLSDRLVVMKRGKIVAESIPAVNGKPDALTTSAVRLPPVSSDEIRPGVSLLQTDRISNNPLLVVENLSAGYERKKILEDISFSAYPGEIIALMGDNGCGKTTLLLALLGVLPLLKGKIFFGGEQISMMKVNRRARSMGLTFQNPNHQIFENTVLKEARLPSLFLKDSPCGEDEQEILHFLEKFDLLQYKDKIPFALSLGEKKRLTLVSVLAYSPKLLILDEPLVGQDRDRLKLLLDALLDHSRKGGLTIMICHEPAIVASWCRRILFLEKGRLRINAPTEEALEKLSKLGRDEYLPSY